MVRRRGHGDGAIDRRGENSWRLRYRRVYTGTWRSCRRGDVRRAAECAPTIGAHTYRHLTAALKAKRTKKKEANDE
jgi:hypothetical protein